jgi:hypothetical protein
VTATLGTITFQHSASDGIVNFLHAQAFISDDGALPKGSRTLRVRMPVTSCPIWHRWAMTWRYAGGSIGMTVRSKGLGRPCAFVRHNPPIALRNIHDVRVSRGLVSVCCDRVAMSPGDTVSYVNGARAAEIYQAAVHIPGGGPGS